MNDPIEDRDSLDSQSSNTDATDFIVKLEKAATLFLSLLRLSKYFKTELSSISFVCDVAQFLLDDSDLGQVTSKHVKEVTTQTHNDFQGSDRLPRKTAPLSEPVDISAIATTVKNRRRKKVVKQTRQHQGTWKKTRNRKSKQETRLSNNLLKIIVSTDDAQEKLDHQYEKYDDSLSQDSTEHPDISKHTDMPVLKSPDGLSEFQCSYCYKVFIDRRNLKSHLWVHEREKNFQCEVCKKLFLRSHQLTRHRRVHTGERPYPCAMCGKAFADVSNLNTHKRKEHPNQVTLLKCEECGKECQSKKDLKLHLAAHDEENAREQSGEETPNTKAGTVKIKVTRHLHRVGSPMYGKKGVFLCQICGKGLNKRAALLAHMKRHIRRKDFCCEFCNKMFPELRELKTHRKEHTGDRPYKCEKCGKGFKSQGTLRSHLGVHSGEQPYRCDVCGRTFSQTSGLNQHKLKHTAEEEKMLGNNSNNSNNKDSQNSCDICGRCYKTKFRLQLHLKSHDSKRDVSCDFCEKKFQTAQDLAIHRRSHTKDKYSCRVCGASFKSRSLYYFHTRTHQIDRPYLCSSCGKSFISANDLNAHKRRHTVGDIIKRQHEQFICNVCGKIYQMKNSLIIHMKIHQGIFDHPCDFCEKKFKSHAELRHHRRVHTLEKPYACETCDRQFSRHSTLVNHRRTHSGERPYMCPTCGAAFKLSCTLKKHAKVHTRETHGGKGRANTGRAKNPNSEAESPPSTPDVYQQQTQQEEQLQHQQQQLLMQQLPQAPLQPHHSVPICLPTITAPQLVQKSTPIIADASQQNHFIHELKPVTTSIMQMDNSGLISGVPDILIAQRNPTTSLIQQQMRGIRQNETNERETVKDLIEMQNAVPNLVQYTPGSSTFTTYYYY